MSVLLFRHIAVSLAALLCSQPAYASGEMTTIDPAKARLISVNFTKCIVSKRRLKPIAIRFLLEGRQADGRLVASSNCFVTALTESGLGDSADELSGHWKVGAFRNMIASGLMQTEFKDNGPTDFSAVPTLPELQPVPQADPGQDVERTAQLLSKLGECAARRDPDAIRRMAQTEVNSPDELTSLRRLAPVFGGCMEVGVTLKLTRDLMRDYAVLGYARLAYTLQSIERAPHDAEAKN